VVKLRANIGGGDQRGPELEGVTRIDLLYTTKTILICMGRKNREDKSRTCEGRRKKNGEKNHSAARGDITIRKKKYFRENISLSLRYYGMVV